MSNMENPRDMLRMMKLSPPGKYGNDVYLPHPVTDDDLAKLGYIKVPEVVPPIWWCETHESVRTFGDVTVCESWAQGSIGECSLALRLLVPISP